MNKAREYIWTYSGERFFFDEPAPSIKIIDIAHALSNICRWTGHVKKFYSVAQHSVLCSQWAKHKGCKPTNALYKLLHDASEAYMADLNKPLKNSIGPFYEEIESVVQNAIFTKYGLAPMTPEIAADVKKADRIIAMTEARDLLGQMVVEHYEGVRPTFSVTVIQPVSPLEAEEMFIQRFKELM